MAVAGWRASIEGAVVVEHRADAGEIESVYNIGMYGTLFSMRFRLGFFQSVGRVENRILGLGATATTRGIGRRVWRNSLVPAHPRAGGLISMTDLDGVSEGVCHVIAMVNWL